MWVKRFYWLLCLSVEFFLVEIYFCMLGLREFIEMVISNCIQELLFNKVGVFFEYDCVLL